MKILRAYIRIPPVPGGMETHIQQLSIEQRELGHEVCIAFNQGENTSLADIQIFPNFDLVKYLKAPLYFIVFKIGLIYKLIRNRNKYEVIHLHGDWSSFIFAPILKRLVSAKQVVFTFHGVVNERLAHRIILPFALRFSDVVFFTGFESYSKLKDKCHAVFQPSGVRELFYQPISAARITNQVLTVAVLRAKKNIETVLAIAKLLPHYSFVIAGDGDQRELLQGQLDEMQLQNVRFVGAKNAEEVRQLMHKSSVFLYASLWEGTPTAIMEAMACGLPVVSSNAGGVESIIKDDINGFVIRNDYTNALAYADALQKIIGKELLESMSSANQLQAEKFKWQYVANRITSIMKKEN